jgi:hypothetical protein
VYCAALVQVISRNRRIFNHLDLRNFTRLLAVFDPKELLVTVYSDVQCNLHVCYPQIQ